MTIFARFVIDRTTDALNRAERLVFGQTVTQQLFTESDSDYFNARVIVTGHFDPDTSMGCFAPKFGIKTTKVELKSEIATEPMPKRSQE